MATIPRRAYAEMFGPTTGDRVRLADTDLVIEVEDDFTLRAGGYGEEVKFGGGKTIRDGMAQSQRARAEGAMDTVLTNALVHGDAPARLHVYVDGATWVCHVHDAGSEPIDSLTGLLPPAQPSDHGYGLWLARQLCTAVDVGHDPTGTHVRLHARV